MIWPGDADEPRAAVRQGIPLRLALTAFILFHIVAVLLWLTPVGTTSAEAARTFAANYVSWGGLGQNWGMFAPEPSNLNIYLSANITYQDGSQHTWDFPRMDQIDLVSRYYQERYRKFEEYAHLDSASGMWPDLAVWIARQNNPEPGNPPVRVQLTRNWWTVPPPPPNGDISHDPPHQWQHYLFFETAIQRSQL